MADVIFIGVDGGGSKTSAVCQTLSGDAIGRGEAGASNIKTDLQGAYQAVYQAINQALSQAGLALNDKHYCYHLGMGLAGTEVSGLHAQFLALDHPVDSVILVSDAHIACLGAHAGDDGSIVIAGTGVIGYQIVGEQTDHVAGWGFPHADEGGGAWLGLEALRLTFQWIDGCRTVSPMITKIYSVFDNKLAHLVDWANCATPKDYATLAPLVAQYAQHDDPYATHLMHTAAEHIHRVFSGLSQRLPAGKTQAYALLGGLASDIEQLLAEKFRCLLVQPQYDAMQGAVLMMRKQVLN